MSDDKTELDKALEYCKKAQEERIRDMKVDDLINGLPDKTS